MSEAEEISKAVKDVRTKEANLGKRYKFDLKFTYWDADDLSFLMKTQNDKYLLFNRGGPDVVLTCDPKYRHPSKFTVRPDQLVELFTISKEHLEKIIMTQEVFSDLGGIEMKGLTTAGVEEMEAWCRGLDAEIVRVAKDLKKQKVEQIFKKMWIEMGGDAARPTDRVAKRVGYIKQLTEAFRADQKSWNEEMKRVGLK